jgi:SAM-dependent methyltransferase
VSSGVASDERQLGAAARQLDGRGPSDPPRGAGENHGRHGRPRYRSGRDGLRREVGRWPAAMGPVGRAAPPGWEPSRPHCKTPGLASTDEVRHPLFARFVAWESSKEPEDARANRRAMLTGVSGRVVEVGAGTGVNFTHYPETVSEVVAVEPEPFLREKCATAAAAAPVLATVVDGVADRLPFEDGSVDAAGAWLMLCSVPDQATALREMHRVLRPGGELRFYEHVLSPRARMARVQRLVDRTFWPRTFGGCHTARDTPAAIAAAGFEITRLEPVRLSTLPFPIPVEDQVIGTARRR